MYVCVLHDASAGATEARVTTTRTAVVRLNLRMIGAFLSRLWGNVCTPLFTKKHFYDRRFRQAKVPGKLFEQV
jgi:hypothetical protein